MESWQLLYSLLTVVHLYSYVKFFFRNKVKSEQIVLIWGAFLDIFVLYCIQYNIWNLKSIIKN